MAFEGLCSIYLEEIEPQAGQRCVRMWVDCSKGTYIRTLAQDIGRVLGCFGHLSALRRTQVGPFMLDQAVELETLQSMESPEKKLIAMQDLPAGLVPPAKNAVPTGSSPVSNNDLPADVPSALT